jgi:hypothetical protein
MAESSFERRVFWDRSEIPDGTKALVITVKDPIITLVAEDVPDEEFPVFDEKLAYVEITREEWASVKDDPEKADELAQQFGRLVQEAMGASWHRWHPAQSESSD